MQRIITVEKFHSLVFRVCNWMDQLDGFNNPRSRWRENGFDPGRKFHFERGEGWVEIILTTDQHTFVELRTCLEAEIPNYSLVPGQNFQLIKVRASNPIPFSVNLPPRFSLIIRFFPLEDARVLHPEKLLHSLSDVTFDERDRPYVKGFVPYPFFERLENNDSQHSYILLFFRIGNRRSRF